MTAGVNNVQRVAPFYPQGGCFGGNSVYGDDIFYGNDDIATRGFLGNNFSPSASFSGMGYGMGTSMDYGMGSSMGYGMGYGMPPIKEGEDPTAYKDRVRSYFSLQNEIQNDLQNSQLSNQIEYQKRMNGASFAMTSEQDMITRQIGILQTKVKNNEQDDIMSCYNKLLETVRQQLRSQGIHNFSNDQVKAYAEKLYFQATGNSLTDDIAQHGGGQFSTGLKQGLFCGLGSLLCNNRTAKENIAEITGQDVSKKDKFWKGAGQVISGALTGALAIFAAIKAPKLLAAIFKK